jgi:endonuclease YncB( thermonuclease family)
MGNRCFGVDTSIPCDLDKKQVPKYVPQIERGRVLYVYDGDTIHIAGRVKHNPDIFKFSVRLNRLDCPEMTSKNPEEKEMAELAKKYIQDRIEHKCVELKQVSLDKYGRLLAEVIYMGANINQELIDKRLAVEYDGGTKKSPSSWKTYYECG